MSEEQHVAILDAIAHEVFKVLEARGVDVGELDEYLDDLILGVPDEVTPDWLHQIASELADEFFLVYPSGEA